jgi:formate dehydrogenase subunit delta
MSADKLVRMANQIATFMASQAGEGEIAGVEGVALHLKRFWEPRMLQQLQAHVAAGGAGLNPMVIQAAGRLAA